MAAADVAPPDWAALQQQLGKKATFEASCRAAAAHQRQLGEPAARALLARARPWLPACGPAHRLPPSPLAGNGALAGLVAITGGCAFVDTWAAMIIGFVAGGVYYGASKLVLHRLQARLPSVRGAFVLRWEARGWRPRSAVGWSASGRAAPGCDSVSPPESHLRHSRGPTRRLLQIADPPDASAAGSASPRC